MPAWAKVISSFARKMARALLWCLLCTWYVKYSYELLMRGLNQTSPSNLLLPVLFHVISNKIIRAGSEVTCQVTRPLALLCLFNLSIFLGPCLVLLPTSNCHSHSRCLESLRVMTHFFGLALWFSTNWRVTSGGLGTFGRGLHPFLDNVVNFHLQNLELKIFELLIFLL